MQKRTKKLFIIRPIPRDIIGSLQSRFLLYLCLYALFILPILRANYLYVDDIGRALNSYAGWWSVGRPLANILMESLNFNRWTILDLAPLPQLLAIAILALASAWSSIAFRLRNGLALLPVAFLVCNPFFIENLSYRYDAFGMAAAVACALLPLALEAIIAGPILYASTILALLLALNLYQPALNIFIVVMFFTALLNLRETGLAPTIRTLALNLACLATALIVYKIESAFIPFQPYAKPHTAFVSIRHPTPILTNIQNCTHILARYLLHSHQTQLLLAGLAFGLIATLTGTLRHTARPTLAVPLAILLMIGLLAGIMGPEILLQHPVWAPRVLMGFGAAIACSLALLVLETRNGIARHLVAAFLVVTLTAQFSLVYAFGNVLIAQSRLDDIIADQIVNDAFQITGNHPATLTITGRAPHPLDVAKAIRLDPILHRLLPSHQVNFWTWGPFLGLRGLPPNVKFTTRLTADPAIAALVKTCTLPIVATTRYDTIFRHGPTIIVAFQNPCPPPTKP